MCDLLWSLAFNNGLVKEVVGRQGGIALILKGMSSHLSSPELVKSACGALSNMCQNTYNQNLIVAHGGVRCVRHGHMGGQRTGRQEGGRSSRDGERSRLNDTAMRALAFWIDDAPPGYVVHVV